MLGPEVFDAAVHKAVRRWKLELSEPLEPDPRGHLLLEVVSSKSGP